MAVAPAFLALLGTLQWTALPLPNADRVVQVNAGLDLVPLLGSMNQFHAVSGFTAGWTVAEGPRGSAAVLGAVVDPGFFAVLGSGPDVDEGAVMTMGLFRRLFGNGALPDHAVVRVWDRPFSVQGVIADQPVYPAHTELWVARSSGIQMDPAFLPSGVSTSGILGRLNDGVSVPAAATAVQQVARQFEKKAQASLGLNLGDIEVVTLAEMLRRRSPGERGLLSFSLTGLLAFVLLAYASALAGFLAEREREFAIRAALGARRTDLVRLLLVQIALLAIPGFLAGLPIAVLVLGKLSGVVPAPLAALLPPRIDVRALALATAAWTGVVLLAATAAWLGEPQAGLATAVLGAERSQTARVRPRARQRLGFVCAALSLAVTLGAVTSVLRHSVLNLEREPLGFEPRNAAAAVFRFGRIPDAARFPAVLSRLRDRLLHLHGVVAVAFSDTLPFGGPGQSLEVSTPERPGSRMGRVRFAEGDYLAAAGMRLVAGHRITPQEEDTGAPVALLDQRGARETFGDVPPLGRTLTVGDRPVEVVGIVELVKTSSVLETYRPQVYLPLFGRGQPSQVIAAVAVTLRSSSAVSERELATAAASEGAAVSQYHRLEESVGESLAPQRLAETLALLQWLTVLALVALSTFGTFSWLLDLRSFELAVRMALGDTRQGIAKRVLGSAVMLVGVAVLCGLVLYVPVSRTIANLLFGVAPLSPGALLGAVAVVAGAALAAAGLAVWSMLGRISLDLLKSQGSR